MTPTSKSPPGKKEVCTGALHALRELMSISGENTVPPNLEEADTRNSGPASWHKKDRGLPGCQVAQSNDANSVDETVEILAFELGVHYPLVEGRLYFSFHPDEAYTCEAINLDRSLFYFSSNFPGTR
jgi:hypothetical protein